MATDKMEEKLKKDAWWVLQEIKKENIATPDDEYTSFEPQQGENFPALEDQRRAIKLLVKEKAIKIVREKFPLNMGYTGANTFGWKPMSYLLNILEPDFSKIYKSYEEKFDYTAPYRPRISLPLKANSSEITLGPLAFKNNSIYYKDGILGLTPQAVKLCKLFIEQPETYISDETIKETISSGDFISTGNMQKIVSKLRTTLRTVNKKIDIQRVGNSGYRFTGKDIR